MKKISLCFFVLIFIFSCRKKIDLPEWDVDLIFPVASTTLQISDLVKDSALKVNADQSLSVVYSGEVFKLDFDSLFKIPDTTISQFFSFPFSGFSVNPGFVITDQTQQTKYSLGEVELTKAIIRSGSIDVKLISYLQGKTLLTYKLPLATKNGSILSITDTLPAATSTTPTIITKSYDVSGYEFDLRGLSGNSFNTIVSSFRAVALDTTFITPDDTVKISNSMVNIIPEFARGYFGQTVVKVEPQNQAVTKLHNITGGKVDFRDFNLTLKIKNGIGVDIQFLLNQIISSNISPGENVTLAGTVVGSTNNINRASVNNSSDYPPISFNEYVINMNDSNSNADELIEIFPDSISAEAEISLNPLGNISNSNDFVFYGNGINVSLDAEVPLCLVANNLVLVDTVEINFQTKDEKEEDDLSKNITGGSLILDVYNSYPFSARPQLYLMNELYEVSDSLVSANSLIESADLNPGFYSVGKKFSKIIIPVDQDIIEKLKAAKNMMIKLSFSTGSQPDYVKIFSEYSVDIKVVADIEYHIENKK